MAGKPRTPAEFRIDWNYGYSLYDTQSNECVWKYRYSQLKGSSDDGISSLKLLFRDEKTGGIETRVSSYFVQLCRIQNYTVQRFP